MRNVLRLFLLLIILSWVRPVAWADEVTDWNEHLFTALIQGNVVGLLPSRAAAIVQSSVFDALNGIEERYEPIHVQTAAPPGASRRAAVVQAAYVALSKLFPAQQADFEAKRAASLAAIGSGDSAENSQSIARGIAWGQTVADAIWAWRLTDGFSPAPPPNTGSNLPGQWRPTLPAFAPFALIQFGTMTPWAIQSPSQFALPGPPSLTSSIYTADFNEVKLLGSANSAARTVDQTDIARFWNNANGPNYFWNRVAIRFSTQKHLNLSENARLLALLNLSIADAGIAVWNAKIRYNFWRPITAIQLADTDGNVATTPDGNWLPLLNNPAYPDYPSGLCGTTGGAVGILSRYFGEDSSFFLDSNAAPGVTRNFSNFESALRECIDARVWGGIHFRTADVDGGVLGHAVAGYVFDNALQPLRGERKGQLSK